GVAHEAAFETKAPIAGSDPTTLLIVLDQQTIHEEHTVGRFRLSASTARSPSQEIATRPPTSPLPIDPGRVDQAIQRGITWLRQGKYPAPTDIDWATRNPNELILWTYLHAGVTETDPDFQKRLKQMLDAPLERTYRVSLQAMILEELDRVAYQPRIWQCAQ